MKDIEKLFQEYIKNISIAINYIANVIEGHNHIKDILQKEGVKVFVLGTELVDTNFNKNKKNELKKTFSFIVDMMEIAKVEGVVSEMNFDVFSEGVSKFISFVEGINGEQTPMSNLMQNLINMQNEIDRKNAKELASNNLNFYPKSDLKNLNTDVKKHEETSLKDLSENINKKDVVDVVVDIVEDEDSSPTHRKEIIVNLLKDKGGQNVKDIKNVIGHVTDKTILRDITELMLEKKVFRVGEKRWAKYYLK